MTVDGFVRGEAVLGWGDPGGEYMSDGFVLPTGTVAFLLTDVESSTAAWELDQEAMAAAMERHNEILDVAVSAHGGVRPLAQGEGDSIVAAFSRASDAVLAALDAQRALGVEPWPTTRPLRVRMAVHTGEARTGSDGNYAGQAIIRTARLRAIAHGGQVLVSAPARDLTVDHLGDQISFIDLGEHRLKDLARPELVFQLTGNGLETDFPALASLNSHNHNLPLQLSSFIGRVEEIGTVATLVRTNRLVTIIGAGGAGKTRLSQQVAAEVLGVQSDGTYWIELAEVRDPEAVATAVGQPLDCRVEVGPNGPDQLAQMIGTHHWLLVIDNCEHVIEPIAKLVDGLLRACPNIRILATSREPLEVPGEVAWRIPPLSVPVVQDATPLAALSQYDSVRLFLDRAQKVRPNFHLTDENAPSVASICQRLDGIPLAIELAAARVRSMTPEQIRDGLADAFRLLTGGGRVSLQRQATLEASISWSHDLLTPSEQTLLHRLAVFSGGGVLSDIEAVVGDATLSSHSVLDALDRLVAQSLVVLDDLETTPRYRLLETVRQYATRKLEGAGELNAWKQNHAEYFRDRMLQLAPQGMEFDNVDVSLEMGRDVDNVLAALDTFAVFGDWDSYITVATRAYFLMQLADEQRGAAMLQRGASESDIDPDDERMVMIRGYRSNARLMKMDIAAAPELIALQQLADEKGYALMSALARMSLAMGLSMANPEQAVAIFEEMQPMVAASGEPMLEMFRRAGPLYFLANMLMDVQAARGAAELTAPFVDAMPNSQLGGVTYHASCALVSAWAGDFERASHEVASARRIIDRVAAFGSLNAIYTSFSGSQTLYAEGWIALLNEGALGRLLPDVLGGWASIRRERFAMPGVGMVLSLHYLTQGDYVSTERVVGEVKEASRNYGMDGVGHSTEAYARLGRGDLVGARAALAKRPAPYARMMGLDWDLAKGWLDLFDGEDVATVASDVLEQAREWELRLPHFNALELLSACAASEPDHCARLRGAIARARNDLGFRLTIPPLRERTEVAAAHAREALGDAAYDAAFQSGYAMTLDESTSYVLRTRGERKRPTSGWASLTPTEIQVVELAAEGHTNPEIAEKLIMGRETVKTHMSNVFTKLGVKNRTELGARLAERR